MRKAKEKAGPYIDKAKQVAGEAVEKGAEIIGELSGSTSSDVNTNNVANGLTSNG